MAQRGKHIHSDSCHHCNRCILFINDLLWMLSEVLGGAMVRSEYRHLRWMMGLMKRFKCRVCCPIIAVWGIVHTHTHTLTLTNTHKRAVRINPSKNIVHFSLKNVYQQWKLIFLLFSGTEESKWNESVSVWNIVFRMYTVRILEAVKLRKSCRNLSVLHVKVSATYLAYWQ